MTRGPVLILAAAGLMAASFVVGRADAVTEPPVRHVWVESGDSWSTVAARCGSTATAVRNANYLSSNASLRASSWLHCPFVPTPTTTTGPSSSTTASSSTVAATTTTTSTLAPTTSVAVSTSTSTTTSAAPSSTTSTTPPAGGGFVETFDSAAALDRFRTGVYHRGDDAQGDWLADHSDINGAGACGHPVTTSRTAHAAIPAEALFVCTSVDGDATKGHLMSTMGDVTGYSIVWFSPDQTFTAATTHTVSFEASVTFLGGRKWWEVLITPPNAPDLQCTAGFTPCALPVDGYHPGSVVMALDNTNINGTERDVWGAGNYCNSFFQEDPEGCASKQIRRQFSITDNRDGTITFTFDSFGSRTYPGAFPPEFKVVFKDHNYTPLKDGPIQGLTWHWDSIAVG